ncbi:MAG: sensor histidine kinase [Anaerolineae bacterium]|nr:sensor histidine kinase [Anaerolineae bacterium]
MRKGFLFDFITFLTILSVAVGGMDQFSFPPARYAAIGLMVLLSLILIVYEPHACRSYARNVSGLTIMTIIISFLLILSPGWSPFPILFFILSAIAATALPIRKAMLWIAIFTTITLIIFIWFNTYEGLINALPFTAGYFFFGIFGYYMVRAEEAHKRSEELLAELQTAHRQLQHYAAEVEELAITRERYHLAREVHDTLGHQLTVAVVQLEGAQRLITSDPQRAALIVGTVRDQVKTGLGELRRIVATLRAPQEEDTPLLLSIQHLINQFQEATGIQIKADLPETLPSLSSPLRQSFYRAAQEALTNIEKHAHASQVNIRLTQEADYLTLSVEDNGVGKQADNKGGFGLMGLKERAALLGGSFEVQPAEQRGLRLVFSAPLQYSEETDAR